MYSLQRTLLMAAVGSAKMTFSFFTWLNRVACTLTPEILTTFALIKMSCSAASFGNDEILTGLPVDAKENSSEHANATSLSFSVVIFFNLLIGYILIIITSSLIVL